MIPVIHTPRLLLRGYQPDDWQPLYEMVHRYQASGMSIYDEPWPSDAEAFPKITSYLAGNDAFYVVCLAGGTYIGHITLNAEAPGRYNLGYIFDERYHGKGYAAEACRAVIQHAFEELGAEMIVSGTAVVNTPSVRLLERLGFRRTGEMEVSFYQDADGSPILFTGCSWALTRTDWLEQVSPATPGAPS